MKYVFLDVDGVLNNVNTDDMNPGGYTGVSMKLVRNLAKIVERSAAKIVLTSDWKIEWSKNRFECGDDIVYLLDKLAKCNLSIFAITHDSKIEDRYFTDRGYGIRQFLESKDDVEGYVILDDHIFLDFDNEQKNHLVLTDSLKGLTDEDVNKAIDILT